MGFDFEKDGRVCAFLPGHKSGDIEGTYTVLDNSTIKCVFTKYSNESKSKRLIYNSKLVFFHI